MGSVDHEDRRPRLIVVVELEGLPVIHVDARNAEDEERLRGWICATSTLDDVQARIEDACCEALS